MRKAGYGWNFYWNTWRRFLSTIALLHVRFQRITPSSQMYHPKTGSEDLILIYAVMFAEESEQASLSLSPFLNLFLYFYALILIDFANIYLLAPNNIVIMFNRVPFSMQDIIRKYTNISDRACNHAALASALGSLTWEKPLHSEFQRLARYKCLIKCLISIWISSLMC